jgi:hypothetical protein
MVVPGLGALMPALSVRSVAERLKALLPPDGTPVLNRVLRVMLSRDFGQSVSDELYERARDNLFSAGQIGRLRGQGGQIFLAKAENGRNVQPAPTDASSKLSENQLMPHLGRFLREAFRKELDIPPAWRMAGQGYVPIGAPSRTMGTA